MNNNNTEPVDRPRDILKGARQVITMIIAIVGAITAASVVANIVTERRYRK